MPELIAAIDAFMQEHRCCGELEGGVDEDRVWMACDCGADIIHLAKKLGPGGTEGNTDV